MVPAALVIVCLLIAGSLYQWRGATRSAERFAPPGVMLDVHGQRLHVVCHGAGEPGVMFESGIAASSLSWTRVLGDVAAFTHGCAYDRAGLGWSGPIQQPRTVASMLEELDGVFTQCFARKPSILV